MYARKPSYWSVKIDQEGDVVQTLEKIIKVREKPRQIQSDNASEFTSNAVLGWVYQPRNRVEIYWAWKTNTELSYREF